MDAAMDALLEKVWSHLISGADPGPQRSPYTLMQVATIGLDGLPKLRTVVLRRAVRERAMLSFHTDARSEKVRELRQEPRVCALVGDWHAGIQIRAEGIAQVVADRAERLAVWHASRTRSLALYRAPLPPGTTIERPLDACPVPGSSNEARLDGFEHFCLIDVVIEDIDFLDVSGEPHRRAKFSPARDGWRGRWVAP